MEFEGTVSQVLQLVSGEGARGPWQRQDVVFDLPGDFDRKLSVEFWGDRAPKASALRPGDRVTVAIRVDSREYQGRWYTRATGVNINYPRPAEGAPQSTPQPAAGNTSYPSYSAPAPTASAPEATKESNESDDLPF